MLLSEAEADHLRAVDGWLVSYCPDETCTSIRRKPDQRNEHLMHNCRHGVAPPIMHVYIEECGLTVHGGCPDAGLSPLPQRCQATGAHMLRAPTCRSSMLIFSRDFAC